MFRLSIELRERSNIFWAVIILFNGWLAQWSFVWNQNKNKNKKIRKNTQFTANAMSLWNPFYSTPAMYSYVCVLLWNAPSFIAICQKHIYFTNKTKNSKRTVCATHNCSCASVTQNIDKKNDLKETQTTTKSWKTVTSEDLNCDLNDNHIRMRHVRVNCVHVLVSAHNDAVDEMRRMPEKNNNISQIHSSDKEWKMLDKVFG